MRNHAIKYNVYIKYVLLWDYATGMLASCAGLRNLTVASVILLDWAFVRGLASLRAHPSLLVLSATSAQV